MAKKDKKRQKMKTGKEIAKKDYLTVLAIILALASMMHLLSSGITGFFVSEQGLVSYDQNISWKISSDQTKMFEIAQHPEEFNLKTLRLSGTYAGNGSVKAYLEAEDGTRYMILDQRTIAGQELSGITAMFVADSKASEDIPDEAVPDADTEEPDQDEGLIKEDESEGDGDQKEEQEDQEAGQEEEEEFKEPVEDEEEQRSEEQTESDIEAEDKGQEGSEQDTEISQDTKSPADPEIKDEEDSQENRTQNMPKTSEGLENRTHDSDDIQETDYINETYQPEENMAQNISEEINNTENMTSTDDAIIQNTTNISETGQKINLSEDSNISENITMSINQTQEDINLTDIINQTDTALSNTSKTNITKTNITNTTVPINNTEDITNSNTSVNISANSTINISKNIQEDKTEDINQTHDINTTGTKNLTQEFLPLEKYKNVKILDAGFSHEWKNSWGTIKQVILKLDNKENQSVKIGYVVLDVQGYEDPAVYELEQPVEASPGESEIRLPVHFSYSENKKRAVRIRIKDQTTRIITSAHAVFNPKIAKKLRIIEFEDACSETCMLSKGLNSTSYDMVFEVDSGELVIDNIHYVLKNTTKVPVQARFGVSDHENYNIDSAISVGEDETMSNSTISLLQGIYGITLSPEQHTIEKIEFSSVDIKEDFTRFIRLDQEQVDLEQSVQSYAVSPDIEFDTAKISINARGTGLYKCSDWSYYWQGCRTDFEFVKEIVPNQIYEAEFSWSQGDVAFMETAGTNATNISYVKIKEDQRYEAVLDSTKFDNETKTLTVVFHHDYIYPLPVSVKGRIQNYSLDKHTAAEDEQVTLVVSNYNNERFRILVGSHTEAFEFGKARKVSITSAVKDAKNQTIDADIELVDSLTEETKAAKQSDGSANLDEGEYNIKVKPSKHPVKEIEFRDMEVYEDFAEDIRLDDINESEKNLNYAELYAIDPTNLNFTNATVTVTATGTSLYKCKDWNFTMQTCFGNWTLFKDDLVPGQEYTFTLTPEDPGFGEIITSCTAEDDETIPGNFDDPCDSVDGSYLEEDDGVTESHQSTKNNKYAGVRIQSVDSGITNCDSITRVEICYEWWYSGSKNANNCDISVDADEGDSYITVTSTCPEKSENPGITCTDVTSLESWTCSNFFGSSGTRAYAKSELTQQPGIPRTLDIYWDALYFNVTYDSAAEPSTTLFFDDFEHNSLVSWTESGDNNWEILAAPGIGHGSYSAHTQGDGDSFITIADSLDLSGRTNCTLEFYYYISSYESEDDDRLSLDIYDGSWNNEVWYVEDGDDDSSWHDVEIDLDDYSLVDGFLIRFEGDLDYHNDETYIDDVKIICAERPKTNASINTKLIIPAADSRFTRNDFSQFTLNVSCYGKDCGEIDVTLDPQHDDVYQIDSNNRDAWDDASSGSINSNYFGDSDWWDTAGYQFQTNIPPGAVINEAYLSLYIGEDRYYGDDESYTARIRVEDVDDASAFNGNPGNIRDRAYWDASVSWDISENGFSEGWKDSPDITALVQNIVDRDGWNSDNHIGFEIQGITGDNGRHEDIEDYNEDSSLAPKLYVSWTDGKGIIPVGSGTPFYTNKSSNPFTVNLIDGESQLVTFWVNATGSVNLTYGFFAYANLTSDTTVSNSTKKINITIGEQKYSDNIIPLINSVSDSPDPLNQSQNITITANITDNIEVSSAWVEIENTAYSMAHQHIPAVLNIILLCKDSSCTDSNKDVPLKDHLDTALGHDVDTHDASEFDTSSYDVVVISESVNSGNTAWIKHDEVPVLTLEGANNDELELGSGGNSEEGSDTKIYISDNSHYITSPFSTGTLTVSTSTSNLGYISGWSEDVTKLAHYSSDSSLAKILYAEKDSQLIDGSSAAERRVFFGAQYFNSLNADGKMLFNRALDWAAYNTGTGSSDIWTLVHNTSGESGDIPYTVYANDTSDNKVEQSSSYTVDITQTLNITSVSITPDNDELTPGTQINPVETSDVTIALIANISNSSAIDACKVRIWNSSSDYYNPVFIETGAIQQQGLQTQCTAEWNMDHWRNPGSWNISIDINQTDSEADNENLSYHYNELSAYEISSQKINFSGMPGDNVDSSTAYPLTIINTGNLPLNLSIKGTDFRGVSDPSFNISITEVSYSASPAGPYTIITKEYVQIDELNNLAPRDSSELYFIGNVPGIKAQDYQNTLSIRRE